MKIVNDLGFLFQEPSYCQWPVRVVLSILMSIVNNLGPLLHVHLSTLVALIVNAFGLLFQVPCCQWPLHVVLSILMSIVNNLGPLLHVHLSTLVALIVNDLGLLFQVPCCQWPEHVVLSSLAVLIVVKRLMINVRRISDHVQHTAPRMPATTPLATYLPIIC